MIDVLVAHYWLQDLLKELFMDQEIVQTMEQMIHEHEEYGEISEEQWEYLNFLLFVRFSEFGGH